jgi:hypothetical protein
MSGLRILHGWKNLRPYSGRLLALAALSAAEVALRVTLPWPMKVVVDHAAGNQLPPHWVIAIAGRSQESWLLFAVIAGLPTVRAADRILVLHRGDLVAEGTHDVLLQTSDLYRQLAAQLTVSARK